MTVDHPIHIAPARTKVKILWRGKVVAESENALELLEHTYPPVIYVPRADADMALLERSDRETICPYKGVANYFSLVSDGVAERNAVWTYESPLPTAAGIKDHLAFYPDKVEIQRG